VDRRYAVIAALVAAAAGSARADAFRLYSYDPADAETRAAAGPLTFEFRKGLFRTVMVSVRATEAQATADLKSADERGLGAGGLKAFIGAAPQRDLYEVKTDQDGPALIAAFCPGATRAWMAFGAPRPYQSLRVYVLGPKDGAAGPIRLCRTLNFIYHGAWSAPPADKLPPRLPRESPFSR